MVGSRTLDEERVQMIREMVAGCFADLKPEKVTVSDLNGRVYSVAGENGLGGSGGNHMYFTTKAAAQKHYQDGILRVLAYVPGVTVAVNVTLTPNIDGVCDDESVVTVPALVTVAVIGPAEAGLNDATPNSSRPS